MLFRTLWCIDVIAAAIAVAFFFIGVADGSVSSFNIALWIALLGAIAVVVLGSRALERKGQRWPGERARGAPRDPDATLWTDDRDLRPERHAVELGPGSANRP